MSENLKRCFKCKTHKRLSLFYNNQKKNARWVGPMRRVDWKKWYENSFRP